MNDDAPLHTRETWATARIAYLKKGLDIGPFEAPRFTLVDAGLFHASIDWDGWEEQTRGILPPRQTDFAGKKEPDHG